MFQTFTGIVALSALLSFLNKQFLKLPETIGILILAIIVSLCIGSIQFFHRPTFVEACQIVDNIDFRTILFDFLLGFLLFAGSLHINVGKILNERSAIIAYSSLGVIVSTFLIGTVFYYAIVLFGIEIDYINCLIFGALISPTDPVAVLAILQKAGVPKKMEIKIVGESLFNDGIGIVIFVSLLLISTSMEGEFTVTDILEVFSVETLGGIAMGFALGSIGWFLISRCKDNSLVAVHISLAIVMGGYALSSMLHVSGALAMVIAGLVMGRQLANVPDDNQFKTDLNTFWKIIDEVLNAVLFLLIGLEIVSFEFDNSLMLLSLISIVTVILSRFASLTLSGLVLNKNHNPGKKGILLMTWAGLRGGISIALALSLPESSFRETFLFVTYAIVVFSILVQGLTLENLSKRFYPTHN